MPKKKSKGFGSAPGVVSAGKPPKRQVELGRIREKVGNMVSLMTKNAAHIASDAIQQQIVTVDSYPTFAGRTTRRKSKGAFIPVAKGESRDLYDTGEMYESVSVEQMADDEFVVVVDTSYAEALDARTNFIDKALQGLPFTRT